MAPERFAPSAEPRLEGDVFSLPVVVCEVSRLGSPLATTVCTKYVQLKVPELFILCFLRERHFHSASYLATASHI